MICRWLARRIYDAKHLAAHPQQKVTELAFFLRVSGYADGGYAFKISHHIFYNFAFSLKRRGDKRALTTGAIAFGRRLLIAPSIVTAAALRSTNCERRWPVDPSERRRHRLRRRLRHEGRNLGQARC